MLMAHCVSVNTISMWFGWLDPVSFLCLQLLWVVVLTHIGWIVQAAHACALNPVKADKNMLKRNTEVLKSTKTGIKIIQSRPVHHRHSNVALIRTWCQPSLCQPISISNVIAQSLGFGDWQTQLFASFALLGIVDTATFHTVNTLH